MNTTVKTNPFADANGRDIDRDAARATLTLRTISGSIVLTDRGIKSISYNFPQRSSRDASETTGMMLFELDRILTAYKANAS